MRRGKKPQSGKLILKHKNLTFCEAHRACEYQTLVLVLYCHQRRFSASHPILHKLFYCIINTYCKKFYRNFLIEARRYTS